MSRSIAVLLFWAGIAFFAGEAAGQTPAADALLAKADNLVKQGKYDGALDAATEALRAVELAFGTSDPRIVKALKETARIYQLLERNGDAEAAYRRALALLERSPAPDRKEVAELKAKLALAEMNSRRAEAERASRAPATQRSFAKRALTAPGAAPGAAPPSPAPALSSSPHITSTITGSGPTAEPPVVSRSPGGASGGHAPVQSIPQFPWPPPTPSTSYAFPKDVFSRYTTVGEVSDTILTALERSGYVERSFFQTGDGGIALVTRLERITSDGSPAAETERWPAGFDDNPASFVDFVRGLFFAKAGRYRVIVFILQEASFRTSEIQASAEDAEMWLTHGLIKLPPQLAAKPFGKDSTCTALIYEFSSDGTAVKRVTSSLTGKQHLMKAGLLAALEKPN